MTEPILMFVAAYVAVLHGMMVLFVTFGLGAAWIARAKDA